MGASLRTRTILSTSFLLGTLSLFFLIPSFSPAQITFEKTYGGPDTDCGYSVRQTLDGGYVIAGYTESFGVGYEDVYLIKTDSLGNTLWERTYGGSEEDAGYSVCQTPSGEYAVIGYTYSFGAGLSDVYLVGTDSMGNASWHKTYGGNNSDRGWAIQHTPSGGYVITGYTRSFGAGNSDVYFLKTDSAGNALWDVTYGDIFNEYGFSVQKISNGGYVIAGITESFGAGLVDVYLVRTDSLGIIVWDKTYGDSLDDWGCSVQPTLDGGHVIAGWTESFGAGGTDVYLVKTDSLGDTVWTTTYGGSSSDWGCSVLQTLDGGYIVSGYTCSLGAGGTDAYLVKTDSMGNTLWERTYGGSEEDAGYSIQQTLDGGYIITGWTESFGAGDLDVYLIKTDENGLVGIQEEDRRSKMENPKSLQNQPNPFRRSTNISYTLPAAGHITLQVYDIAGRLVETLANGKEDAGIHQVHWQANDIRSGIYFYRLETGSFTDTKKMTLLRQSSLR